MDETRTCKRKDALSEFEDRDLIAISGIEHPHQARSEGCELQCGNDVLNVDEIPCLVAVAKNNSHTCEAPVRIAVR
jgi:hypothetical protein